MNKYTFIQAYGLDVLLTDQDDPALWEAALHTGIGLFPATPTAW